MIKIGHSVLALPFAFMGPCWRPGFARGTDPVPSSCWPWWGPECGHGLIAWRMLPSTANPRTADRALPAGKISRRATIWFIGASAVLFMGRRRNSSRTCFLLSPLALLVILGYSFTNGLPWGPTWSWAEPGLAPVGGWLAFGGPGPAVLVLAGRCFFWVAGFDILYALQDEEFDRRRGFFPCRPGWARPGQASGGALPPGGSLGLRGHGRLAGLGPIYAGPGAGVP